MNRSREALLDPALKVSSNDVRWYFITDFYDGPIAGLAFFRERVLRFCCFEEDVPYQRIYVLQELTEAELKEEKRLKAKFERKVGTHGCFDERGSLLPPFHASDDSCAQYFAEESHRVVPQPYDQPIVAWFEFPK